MKAVNVLKNENSNLTQLVLNHAIKLSSTIKKWSPSIKKLKNNINTIKNKKVGLHVAVDYFTNIGIHYMKMGKKFEFISFVSYCVRDVYT